MFNVSRGAIPAAAGKGAVVAALVAFMGYGVGLTQSSHATVAAQTSSPSVQLAPGAATSYAKVVDAVTPAVVTVHVEKRASMVPTEMPGIPDDFFGQFFGRDQSQGQRGQTPRQKRAPRQSGLGSGVIMFGSPASKDPDASVSYACE